MKNRTFLALVLILVGAVASFSQDQAVKLISKRLPTGAHALLFDGLFYETANGRVEIPPSYYRELTVKRKIVAKMSDGRAVTVAITSVDNGTFDIAFSSDRTDDIKKWGIAIDAEADEYYTGLMERVVDGPQQASWKPGITEAMNLRGQKVDMIIKPTTSIYAPFYLSSRGYGVFVKGDWPGFFDFAASDQKRVKIEFEGPKFELRIYTRETPAAIVQAHSSDVGHPILPPKWMFHPWRWRDEHTQRAKYYDGTPVSGPFNSEVMEDVLMMRAYGIPNGVYWIDRPWGPGILGYDDFEIDYKRLPQFEEMVKWLDANGQKTVLWIAPFFQGKMLQDSIDKGYTLADQVRPRSGNNYPMVDLSNPQAKEYWQDGIAKLLKMGVAGFKLDRGEEDIPDDGPHKIFDGRSIRENRNAYTGMYVKAVYDVSKKYRGDDFVLMPRAGYTGTAQYSANWGGDIGGTQEGLRASIIAVQRSAVMGYSSWGSDTCGYNEQLMEQEVCGRWLEFSAFTPIMEVGPTKNLAFWDFPRNPKSPDYDATLIALWRMYARIHEKLVDYGHAQAAIANKTGLPIVRSVFLVDPKNKAAWGNWWTYQYGDDIVVSPVWQKGIHEQDVYLPSGSSWKDAWTGKVYKGGVTVKVAADTYQLPIFIRVGSKIDLGDLNKEWKESQAIAAKRPDLKALEKEPIEWFNTDRKQ